jgi:hypothetical protein
MKNLMENLWKALKKVGRYAVEKLPYGILAVVIDLGKKLLQDRVIGGTNRILDQHGGIIMSLSVGFFQYLVSTPLAITHWLGSW